jgi:hypothetical protein
MSFEAFLTLFFKFKHFIVIKVKNVSKHTNSKEDEITKKRDAKERSLTIVMMVYIGLNFFEMES